MVVTNADLDKRLALIEQFASDLKAEAIHTRLLTVEIDLKGLLVELREQHKRTREYILAIMGPMIAAAVSIIIVFIKK